MTEPRRRQRFEPRRRRYRCGWCGLPSHQRKNCWVEREGRREPDAADRLAAHLAGPGTRHGTSAALAAQIRVAQAEDGLILNWRDPDRD